MSLFIMSAVLSACGTSHTDNTAASGPNSQLLHLKVWLYIFLCRKQQSRIICHGKKNSALLSLMVRFLETPNMSLR